MKKNQYVLNVMTHITGTALIVHHVESQDVKDVIRDQKALLSVSLVMRNSVLYVIMWMVILKSSSVTCVTGLKASVTVLRATSTTDSTVSNVHKASTSILKVPNVKHAENPLIVVKSVMMMVQSVNCVTMDSFQEQMVHVGNPTVCDSVMLISVLNVRMDGSSFLTLDYVSDHVLRTDTGKITKMVYADSNVNLMSISILLIQPYVSTVMWPLVTATHVTIPTTSLVNH